MVIHRLELIVPICPCLALIDHGPADALNNHHLGLSISVNEGLSCPTSLALRVLSNIYMIFCAGNCKGRRRYDTVLCLLQPELRPPLEGLRLYIVVARTTADFMMRSD